MMATDIALPDERLRLRLAGDADEPFLRDLFKTVKGEQFATSGLPPAMLELLLEQQYRAQVSGHAAQFPAAESLIILRENAPIGRLLLDRAALRWHVVDLALMPVARNAGIGHAVMEAVAAAARQHGMEALTLVVATTNEGARRFYARQHFAEVIAGEAATHLRMRKALTV
jgi:ribosomal protein S18 acetylase RimI-like enzyme